MKRQRGFTLLEVLIALVVVALALLALTRTAGGQVRSFESLRERTLAGWVAANVLSETRIATPLPPIGTRDGRTRLANRDWRWFGKQGKRALHGISTGRLLILL
jgi:general secretion pathway protein I